MTSTLYCPQCMTLISLNDEATTALDEIRGHEYYLECTNGHMLSLHEVVLATKLQPSHYNTFRRIQGIESGQTQMRVGEWNTIELSRSFEEIDEIKTSCHSRDESTYLGVRSEAKFDKRTTDHFWIMTCGDEAEWGQGLNVDWTVYGVISTASLEIWRENLIFAARQLLSANYRPSIIQSGVSVESYVYSFVLSYLKNVRGWQSITIDNYIDASKSRDALPLNGVIRVCVQEIMGIQISDQIWTKWRCLRKMRNALAHGNLTDYRDIRNPDGNYFANELDRADFAYRTAVRIVYAIRYPHAGGF
jgi:hypothetical protein